MQTRARSEQRAGVPFVSTGHLPTPEMVKALVAEAHALFKSNTEGENSQVYPALARAARDLFGVCVAGASGKKNAAGEAHHQI
jgi:glutaminase